MAEEKIISKEFLESIKLTKNAKGDWQYEIKVIDEQLTEETLDRLYNIQSKLEKKYGKSHKTARI